MLTEFFEFCEGIYGGAHEIFKSQLGHTIVRIRANGDVFHINLADKERFGKFDLVHQNKCRSDDGKYWFHRQLRAFDLSFAIYAAYSHGFNKVNSIPFNVDDYKRFMTDWRLNCDYQRVQTPQAQ